MSQTTRAVTTLQGTGTSHLLKHRPEVFLFQVNFPFGVFFLAFEHYRIHA